MLQNPAFKIFLVISDSQPFSTLKSQLQKRNSGAPGGIRIRVLIRNEPKTHGVLLTKQTL